MSPRGRITSLNEGKCGAAKKRTGFETTQKNFHILAPSQTM